MTAKTTWIRGLSGRASAYAGEGASAIEPAAFVETQYKQHFGALYRYLVLTGSHPADADDIAQESFLRLFKSLCTGERIARPKQWLVSVAHNLRHDQWQKAVRTAEASTEFIARQENTQEETAIHEERLALVRSAMMRLTSRQRTYLHLRAEGLRLKEIAEIHGVTLQSVAETCARAVETLGKLSNE